MHDDAPTTTPAPAAPPPLLAIGLALLALAWFGLALIALIALGAHAAYVSAGWGGAVGVIGGSCALMGSASLLGAWLLRRHGRGRGRGRARQVPEPEPAPEQALPPLVGSLLEALDVRRIVERSPWLGIASVAVAAVIVVGPRRLMRIGYRSWRILSALQSLERADFERAHTEGEPHANGRARMRV